VKAAQLLPTIIGQRGVGCETVNAEAVEDLAAIRAQHLPRRTREHRRNGRPCAHELPTSAAQYNNLEAANDLNPPRAGYFLVKLRHVGCVFAP
jgi:hypothetical protein